MTPYRNRRLAGLRHRLRGADRTPGGAAPTTRVRALLGPYFGVKAALIVIAL
jgi:hypothetical protein